MIDWTNIAGSKAVSALGLETIHVDDGEFEDGGTDVYRIHVRFRRGRTYVYDVVTRAWFDRFISAASKGRFYVYVIKQRFDYVSKY
jgi:hypothetical protein